MNASRERTSRPRHPFKSRARSCRGHVSGFTDLVGIAGTFERKRAANRRPQAARVGESTEVGKVAPILHDGSSSPPD